MKKYLFSAALLAATVGSASSDDHIGVVNFGNCISESKTGIQEQENMEMLRKQMASMMESTEKELKELSAKFEDTEYLDSLSPKAEEELKAKHMALQEDLGRFQQQFYQMLNHANYQMVHKVRSAIETAAAKVAEEKNLKYVINQDLCFYVHPTHDVTSLVVAEMDKAFDQNAKDAAENGQ